MLPADTAAKFLVSSKTATGPKTRNVLALSLHLLYRFYPQQIKKKQQ